MAPDAPRQHLDGPASAWPRTSGYRVIMHPDPPPSFEPYMLTLAPEGDTHVQDFTPAALAKLYPDHPETWLRLWGIFVPADLPLWEAEPPRLHLPRMCEERAWVQVMLRVAFRADCDLWAAVYWSASEGTRYMESALPRPRGTVSAQRQSARTIAQLATVAMMGADSRVKGRPLGSGKMSGTQLRLCLRKALTKLRAEHAGDPRPHVPTQAEVADKMGGYDRRTLIGWLRDEGLDWEVEKFWGLPK